MSRRRGKWKISVENGEVTTLLRQFDSKAAVEEEYTYPRTRVPRLRLRVLPCGVEHAKLWHELTPKTQFHPDGTAIYPHPWSGTSILELPWIDITDAGKYLASALLNPQEYNGARLGVLRAQEIMNT